MTHSAPGRRSLAGLAPLALIAGCVGPPRIDTPPPPPPSVAPSAPAPRPAPLAADWRNWPYTPGTWTYRREADGSTAHFGPKGAPVLTLRCDSAAQRVYLSRVGISAAPMTIRTTSVTRAVPVQRSGSTVTAALSSTDRLLEAMGFSRGRFVIDQPGTPPLVVPAWAEIERVTEDCRS